MKIDYSYMARLLNVFLAAKTAHITVLEIDSSGVKVMGSNGLDENFLFHFQIAVENNLISDKNFKADSLKSLGIHTLSGGSATIAETPIRLTQAGHDFACALQNKEILVKLRSKFKDAPFKIIFDLSQNLLQDYFKKKIEQLIE